MACHCGCKTFNPRPKEIQSAAKTPDGTPVVIATVDSEYCRDCHHCFWAHVFGLLSNLSNLSKYLKRLEK